MEKLKENKRILFEQSEYIMGQYELHPCYLLKVDDNPFTAFM